MKILCNVCNSTRSEKIFTSQNIHGRFALNKDTFDVYKCNTCTNIFLGGVTINSSYYRKYYKSNYYVVDLGNKFLNWVIKIMDRISYKMKEKMILDNIPISENINVLDVGCGVGVFLAQLRNDKFKAFGVEINTSGVKQARKKGITIYNVDFLELKTDKKFDVITMWHVLEHMPKPQNVIKKAYEMLNKNGILIFAVPNSDSIGFKFGREYYYHLDSPRHLFIPNNKTVRRLLTQSKLKLVKVVYEFYDYPIDLFVSVKNSLLKFIIYPLYPFFKVFDAETLTFIARKY